MPSRPTPEQWREKTSLLRDVVEFLLFEIGAVSNRRWEEFPTLKKKKADLAARLREYDWTPGPHNSEPLDYLLLKTRIAELENQSRQVIEAHLARAKSQIVILQDRRQFWLECLNIHFRTASETAARKN